MIVNMI